MFADFAILCQQVWEVACKLALLGQPHFKLYNIFLEVWEKYNWAEDAKLIILDFFGEALFKCGYLKVPINLINFPKLPQFDT